MTLRIALAQFDFPVGAVTANADRIRALIVEARDLHGADIVLFPELAVSGYPPEDLLLRPRFLADCEAGLASCSQTHKLGRGPYYKRDARRAAAAAAALKRARPQLEAMIAANRQKMAVWRTAESSQIANRVATIKADRDFLARQAALDRVEKANPAVTKYVEFFLAFLIAIDLVALVLKLTHLFSTGGAYERSAAALRANDLVGVHRLQERATVLTRRITLESRALQDADELRLGGETSREEPMLESELGLDERLSRRASLGDPATTGPLGD